MAAHGLIAGLDNSFHGITFDRSELNSEAKAITISPIKTLSSRDKLSDGKNKLNWKLKSKKERLMH